MRRFFFTSLITNKRLYGLERKTHVGAEFFDGDQLVIAFIEVDLNFQEEITAVAFTFAGDALDVFGVDAKPDESGFHGSVLQFRKGCEKESGNIGRDSEVRGGSY